MKRLIFVISFLLIPSICLAGKTGILKVYSEPPGAKIYIDGVYAGITPYQNLETPIGRHEIRVSLTSDYPEQRATRTVTDEDPVTHTRASANKRVIRPQSAAILDVFPLAVGD